jgi:hypothetical protein
VGLPNLKRVFRVGNAPEKNKKEKKKKEKRKGNYVVYGFSHGLYLDHLFICIDLISLL